MKRYGGDFEREADEQEHQPDDETDIAGGSLAGGDLGDDGEVGRAGEAIDERRAIQQHARRQGSEDEVFEAGLARFDVVAADGSEHVKREALQLDGEVERDEIAGRDHQHHAGDGEQDEHGVLEQHQAERLEIVERQQEGRGRADQDQDLEEAGEAVRDERAVEQGGCLDRGGQHEIERDRHEENRGPAEEFAFAVARSGSVRGRLERARHQQRHRAKRDHDFGEHRREGRELHRKFPSFSPPPCGEGPGVGVPRALAVRYPLGEASHKGEGYLSDATPAWETTSSCEPVPPLTPMAPISLPPTIKGLPPRDPITSSSVDR